MGINLEKTKKFFMTAGKKIWEYTKIAKFELIVLFGALILDLLSKFIIAKTMSVGQTVVLIPNFLEFYYTINKKAAFGSSFGLENFLGIEGIRILFLIMTVIAVCVFCFFLYYFRGKHILARLSLALIISGALGNFYDRLFLKGVRDFVQIVFFGLDLPILGDSFAIFNVADMALVFGVIIFAVYFIFMYKTPKEEFAGPVQKFEDENGNYLTKAELEQIRESNAAALKEELQKPQDEVKEEAQKPQDEEVKEEKGTIR